LVESALLAETHFSTLSGAAWVFQRQGDQLIQAGDMKGAARAYDQAVRLAPGDPILRVASGVTQAATGNLAYATANFRAAVTLAHDDVVAAYLLQVALREQGKSAEAQTVLFDLTRRFAPVRPGGSGAAALDASGSIARYRLATLKFPQSPLLWLLHGDACQIGEKWPEAERAYRRAAELAPRWAKPRVNQGIALLSQDRAEDAIRAFEDALNLEPSNPQVLLSKGDAQVRRGRIIDAMRTFARVGGSREDRAEAKTRIGQILLKTGQAANALRELNAARRLAPGNLAPAAALAEAHVKTGDLAAGVEAYRSALKLADTGGLLSTRPLLLRGMAEAQLSLGRTEAARDTLRRALDQEPSDASLWHRLIAETFFTERNREKGEAALRQALEADLERYPITALNAIAGRNLLPSVTAAYQAELGDREGGRRVIALVALAHLAQYQGDASREIAFRQQAVAADPRGINWFLLADAFRQRGGPSRFADARNAYREAIERGGLSPAAVAEARSWLARLTR
jgi:tetratricopeptide (TPR) repeat protein